MAKNKAYYEEVNMKNQLHLREILDELPPYCKQFFIGNMAERGRLIALSGQLYKKIVCH